MPRDRAVVINGPRTPGATGSVWLGQYWFLSELGGWLSSGSLGKLFSLRSLFSTSRVCPHVVKAKADLLFPGASGSRSVEGYLQQFILTTILTFELLFTASLPSTLLPPFILVLFPFVFLFLLIYFFLPPRLPEPFIISLFSSPVMRAETDGDLGRELGFWFKKFRQYAFNK